MSDAIVLCVWILSLIFIFVHQDWKDKKETEELISLAVIVIIITAIFVIGENASEIYSNIRSMKIS